MVAAKERFDTLAASAEAALEQVAKDLSGRSARGLERWWKGMGVLEGALMRGTCRVVNGVFVLREQWRNDAQLNTARCWLAVLPVFEKRCFKRWHASLTTAGSGMQVPGGARRARAAREPHGPARGY